MNKLLLCLFIALATTACQSEYLNQDDNEVNTTEERANSGTFVTFPNGIVLELRDGQYYMATDMILTEEQVSILTDSLPSRSSAVMNGFGFAKRWIGGDVYYAIANDVPNQSRIINAIAHWQAYTPIRFHQRVNQTDYVEFRRTEVSGLAESNIGRVGGKQYITLSDDVSWYAVAHEIGHTVGLYHEQSRKDRDNYVTINWNNLPTSQEVRINYQQFSDLTNHGVFDFNSLMMYSSFDFAIDPSIPTMTKKNGSVFLGGFNLSAGDIAGVRYLYRQSFFSNPSFLLSGEYEAVVGTLYNYQAPTINGAANMVWRVEDGKGDAVSFSQHSTSHISLRFPKAGIYTISCNYYDGRENMNVGQGYIEVMVSN